MLRHIVMVKFKDRESVSETSDKLKKILVALEKSVDSLKRMEVGININTRLSAFDVVLIADFDDEAGLNSYRIHPEHVKVLDFLKDTMEKSAAVDYWV
ncbi:MAG: Dabb family protein [Bacteroidetes bacterium]|nr:MAG: Dabb family protein [Bacteroidota bacterium]